MLQRISNVQVHSFFASRINALINFERLHFRGTRCMIEIQVPLVRHLLLDVYWAFSQHLTSSRTYIMTRYGSWLLLTVANTWLLSLALTNISDVSYSFPLVFRSPEWNLLSDSDRSNMNLTFNFDGEFWWVYVLDEVKIFSVHLNLRSNRLLILYEEYLSAIWYVISICYFSL